MHSFVNAYIAKKEDKKDLNNIVKNKFFHLNPPSINNVKKTTQNKIRVIKTIFFIPMRIPPSEFGYLALFVFLADF